jgi:DNA-directed RNA polymerase specialized sigma24 family protein
MLGVRRPESPFLRTLWNPLVEDVLREVQLAARVALLEHHGLSQRQIADRLGVQQWEVLEARKRVSRARARLAGCDRPAD